MGEKKASPSAGTTRRRAFDHERFKNVTAAVQSIVVSLAALAAGAWAIYEFQALRDERRIEAQAREEEKHPIFNVFLAGTVLPDRVEGVRHIRFVAHVENIGSRETYIVFATVPHDRYVDTSLHAPLRVARILPANPEEPTDHPARTVLPKGNFEAKYGWVSWSLLRPGQRTEFEFLVPAEEPGVYLGTFSFTSSDKSFMEAKARRPKTPTHKATAFSDSTLVVVPVSDGQQGAGLGRERLWPPLRGGTEALGEPGPRP